MAKFSTIYVFLALSVCHLFHQTNCQFPEVDTSGWIDPTDMGRGIPLPKPGGSSSSRGGHPTPEPHSSSRGNEDSAKPRSIHDALLSCTGLEKQLKDCKSELKEAYQTINTKEIDEDAKEKSNEEFVRVPVIPPASNEDIGQQQQSIYSLKQKLMSDPFLTRFVKNLLNAIDDNYSKHLLIIDIEKEDLETLKRFAANQKVNMHDVDAILTSMITSSSPDLAQYPNIIQRIATLIPPNLDPVWLFMVACVLLFLYFYWMGASFIKMCIVFLILSSTWHWGHMYKKALSQKHSVLIKNRNIPKECFPEEMTWSHLIYDSVFVRTDRCSQYHEALLVDPLWEVTPTMAIAETISRFVILPLGHLGKGVGQFFDGMLQELSVFSATTVLIFVFFAITLILIMMFGYSIQLPLFLGRIESRGGRQNVVQNRNSGQESLLHEELRVIKQQLQNLSVQNNAAALAVRDEGDALPAIQDQQAMLPPEPRVLPVRVQSLHSREDQLRNKPAAEMSQQVPEVKRREMPVHTQEIPEKSMPVPHENQRVPVQNLSEQVVTTKRDDTKELQSGHSDIAASKTDQSDSIDCSDCKAEQQIAILSSNNETVEVMNINLNDLDLDEFENINDEDSDNNENED